MEQKKKFEPFERVIFRRDHLEEKWTCGEFSHIEDEYYVLAGNECFKIEDTDILPFEGNAHLVGTSDMPEEEVELKEKEAILVFDDIEKNILEKIDCCITTYKGVWKGKLMDYFGNPWNYCIPLSQFNPNDMEETRKNVLCVKKGKLVKVNKYK